MNFLRLRTIKLLFIFVILTLLFSVYLYASIQYDRVAPLVTHLHTKSIRKLFKYIDKYDKSIKKSLKSNEVQNFIDLRLRFQQAEAELESTQTTTTLEEDENDSENDNVDQQKLLNRSTLVKLIKLDKYLLEKRRNLLRTVEKMVQNDYKFNIQSTIWSDYHFYINELSLPENPHKLKKVLHDLSSRPIINCAEKERGTQIKLVITLDDDTQAIVKPMKVPRDYVTPDDHFYFVDFERHHAEIASFHVDRVLGFNRVPPTVGRIFNITRDFWENTDPIFANTFFYSPVGNTCFTGHCSYYCDTTHATCGKPRDRLEGSTQLMLPRKPFINWLVTKHPFKRSYNKKKQAEWEDNENYCEEKVLSKVYYQSKNILDIIDMSIFDFIVGNMDRHHFEKLISLGNDTFSLHLDNGRAFGKPHIDELSILAPLTQCCLFRYSTYLRLKHLYFNGFSKLLDESLKQDPLYPILTREHLNAVDRRLIRVFLELEKCLNKHIIVPYVMIDDGY